MSNSNLVDFTRLSPNCNKPRNHKIDKITIHHMAGNLSVKRCGALFAKASRKGSSNYGVDSKGRVGLYVDEANRSWCSSNRENDHRAVTIEVANDEIGGNWHVSDKALAKLIDLCVDICKRNGIEQINYTGDKTGNLTMHKWFTATACPGPYLESKFPYIAEQVNKKLQHADCEEAPTTSSSIKKGDLVSIVSNAKYCNGKTVPSWVKKKKWIVSEISDDRAIIDKSEDGKNSICSPINAKYLSVVKSDNIFKPYLVKVTTKSLAIRKGAGTNYAKNGTITDYGVYTIVDESTGKGSKKGWGKLKSGSGWIALDHCKKV